MDNIPDPFAPAAPVAPTLPVHATSTDAEILAALDVPPAGTLLQRLKAETHAAYQGARSADCDWRSLDDQFRELQNTLSRNARISESVAPNCHLDRTARVETARALMVARDRFIGQTPNTRPRMNCVPTSLYAKRLAGIHDPHAEAQVAAGAFGVVGEPAGPASFAPTSPHKPQRQHGKAASLIGGGAR